MLHSNVSFSDTKVFFFNIYSEMLNRLYISKLISQMYFWLNFPFFWPKFLFLALHVLSVCFNENISKIGCFGLKSTRIYKVLTGTFLEICHIQIQIYPQTYIEPKYGAFYLKNKVSAHGLVLMVQLSRRVAPPYQPHQHLKGMNFKESEILPKLTFMGTLQVRTK